MRRKALVIVPAALAAVGIIAWGSIKATRSAPAAAPKGSVPVTRVKRGDVVITVSAKGELQGGNSEMMVAPMTGGSDMAITYLREPGELVQAGDVVIRFDTTEQDFKLQEAEADLDEAEQQVIQAQADAEAKEEEARYSLLQAQADVKLAELDVRRNPLLAAITARQNTLAFEAARDRLRQLQEDLGNRKETNKAAIAIQEAARNKARVKADTARKNIDNMTLKAKSSGYVNVQQNMNGNFMFWGMELPALQLGDTVRAGMAVAQIPDLKNWEVVANIGELDRGHLSPGQPVQISVVALAGKRFQGKVKDIGGTTGPPWDRKFACKVTLEDPSAELRPGMTARLVITTGRVNDGTWVPSQALFESDGRTYVYLQTANGFVPQDVKLVRRSESQVVLHGISEGQVVAMANPDQQGSPGQPNSGGAMKALAR